MRAPVWVDQGKVMVADKSGTRELPVPDDLMLPPPADPEGASRQLELGPFTRLCEVLRDAIAGKGDQAPVAVPTFRDGLASMQVIDAIRASAAEGGVLKRVG